MVTRDGLFLESGIILDIARLRFNNLLTSLLEEPVEEPPHIQHLIFTPQTQNLNDDLSIHVHKESTTGGGFCAKFVFFILLAILALLVGLIITEHRGLTDCK